MCVYVCILVFQFPLRFIPFTVHLNEPPICKKVPAVCGCVHVHSYRELL